MVGYFFVVYLQSKKQNIMKTFKNKRTGETATLSEGFYKVSGGEIVPKRFIEDSCDWEEVVEKDYQILKELYSSTFGHIKHKILSVKRLSDNEVFTVGDRAQTIGKYPHTISSIEIRQKNKNRDEKDGIDRIWLNWENDCGGNWLEDTEKVKTPVLTTVDGVELFGGERVHFVVTNGKDIRYLYDWHICNQHAELSKEIYKIFAKKENAEEYVKQYKNYKTVDGKQIVEGDVFYIYDNKFYKCLYGSFGQFKSSKWDGKRYRTEEEVLQKIREEKPQYSLKDIQTILLKYTDNRVMYYSSTDLIISILKNLQNEQ